MIDVGLLLMMFGSMVMAISPIDRAIALRRWHRCPTMTKVLRTAYPVPPEDPRLTLLARHAETTVHRSKRAAYRRR